MEKFFKSPTVAELCRGPLAPYLIDIAEELGEDGYAVSTARFQLLVVSDFSGWLETENVDPRELKQQHATMYMQYRDEQKWGKRADAEAALNRLFAFLVRREVISAGDSPSKTEVEEVAASFGVHLREQRGLSGKTVSGYQRSVVQFLSIISNDGKFDASILSAANILRFVQEHVTAQSGSRGRNMLNAVRAFLRFAHSQGYVNTDLAAVVPNVADRTLASIPKAIPPEQVECVLANCDRQTTYGKRDYAILILLARLGLRVGEVVSLSLDDIDWEAGTISVHGKTGPRILPLPTDVGEALTHYLSDARPRAKTRAVFLRLRAPVREMKTQESVCGVVRRAMERARISSPQRGGHQFRHGLATELLRKGASISEIGEILGHQHQRSTMIYAKVDLQSLRKLAMQWPGGAR